MATTIDAEYTKHRNKTFASCTDGGINALREYSYFHPEIYDRLVRELMELPAGDILGSDVENIAKNLLA